MRKLGWILVLAAAPALTLAEGATQGRAAQQPQEQRGRESQMGADGQRQLPKETRAVKQFRAEEGFFTSENYEVEGRISKVSKDKITIQREDLPEVELALASNTRLELEGETASSAQLREGQEVKASFNLQGDTPVAISVEAERREQQQRSGERQQRSGESR